MNIPKVISASLLLSTFSSITMCSDSSQNNNKIKAGTLIGGATLMLGAGLAYKFINRKPPTTLRTNRETENALTTAASNNRSCFVCLDTRGPAITELCRNNHPNDALCFPCVQKLDNCPQCQEPLNKDAFMKMVAAVTARNRSDAFCTIL